MITRTPPPSEPCTRTGNHQNGLEVPRRAGTRIPWLLIAVALHTAVDASPLAAQAAETVTRGDRVRVQWVGSAADARSQRSVGTAVRVSADSITVRPRGRTPLLGLAASQITMLEIGRTDRGKSVAKGAAGGAVMFGAAGLLFAAILTADNGGLDSEAALVLGGGGAVVGASLGSLIGLALPDTRWKRGALPPGD
jgi:hypothetical protein